MQQQKSIRMEIIMSNTKIPGAGSHHIAISSANYDESFKFYTEGLGMKVVATWGEGKDRAAMLDIGDGSHVEIFANGEANSPEDKKMVHFAFKTTDPDTAFKNAIAAGAREKIAPDTVAIPSDPPIPVRIAFVYGPDNEVLEFFQTL